MFMRKLYLMAAIMAALLLAAVSSLCGYRYALAHVVETCAVYVSGSSVYLEIDGQVYEHYADIPDELVLRAIAE